MPARHLCRFSSADLLQIDIEAGSIVIDRHSFEIRSGAAAKLDSAVDAGEFYALYGLLRLLSGPYLVLVCGVEAAARINGHVIYSASDFELMPVASKTTGLVVEQQRAEERCLDLIRTVLKQRGLYFSYTYDVTSPFSQQSKFTTNRDLYDIADRRFFCNRLLLEDLLDVPEAQRHRIGLTLCTRLQAHPLLVPFAHGFFRSQELTSLSGQAYTFALFSRRSLGRIGTRFHSRGVRISGHCANHVESEQVLVCGTAASCFVQVRGSIPLCWSQPPDLRYKPPFRMSEYDDSNLACQRHLSDLCTRFGPCLCINLVNKTGSEGILGSRFQDVLQSIERALPIKSEWFDFHHECRNMQWQHLAKLKASTSNWRQHQGISTMSLTSGRLAHRQKGVIRTNCIDVLDRTNVVQTMFAQDALLLQLQHLAEFLNLAPTTATESALATSWPGLLTTFRGTWADHADEISIQYAGTPAQKSDFTRTGKRTLRGTLRDLYHSALRYFHNNFLDGGKQDALLLLTGQVRVRTSNVETIAKALKGPTHAWHVTLSRGSHTSVSMGSKLIAPGTASKLARTHSTSEKSSLLPTTLPLPTISLLSPTSSHLEEVVAADGKRD
ncbi:uncharacterized protein MONBRDRAFT_24693 [Monosiga brevicollis MX1]|uniref:SAC domain-containing protein n=1 Tax=Monosiga brevicollis TaxID=81824 RepID=A9UX69_MONBE|nr:uncharacterized protein MONBRDRAFT_24693 [Monosiga brevicollis MX1]EDQ90165.1 predicted protein [Monosiga brevicollis MX1]|eukprot:XP_001744932.1 hypothetical protein [Monosiga brevicollis MX1]